MLWTVYHVDFGEAGNRPVLTKIGNVEAANLLAAVMKAQIVWPEERSMTVRPAIEYDQIGQVD